MFKQVFAKLFKSSSTTSCTNQTTTERFDQPQIYSISSCFQTNSSAPTGVTSFYNNETHLTESNESSKSVPDSNLNKTNNNAISKRYNDSTTRQIYIAPHCIRYTNSTLDDTIYRIDDESLNEIAAEILDSENMPPKLQIVFYDGNYFAINNSHLQIYKQLQLSGLITHVQADLINIEAIPVKLRNHLLQTPSHLLELDQLHGGEMFHSDEEILGEESYEMSATSTKHESTHLSNRDSVNSGSTSSDNETTNSFSESKLVDETYEFGECENCVDSNEDEDIYEHNDEDDEDKIRFSSSLEKSFYNDLNTEFNMMTTKKIISNELMKLRPTKSKANKINSKFSTNSQKGAVNTKKSSQIEPAQIVIEKLDHLILPKTEPEDHLNENDHLIESKTANISGSVKASKNLREIPELDKTKNEIELESLLLNE